MTSYFPDIFLEIVIVFLITVALCRFLLLHIFVSLATFNSHMAFKASLVPKLLMADVAVKGLLQSMHSFHVCDEVSVVSEPLVAHVALLLLHTVMRGLDVSNQ